MFTINDDNSIYLNRGDIVFFSVTAKDENNPDVPYKFQAGDLVRIKVYGKKDAEKVVLQKDFPVYEETEEVEIFLAEEDTKIGEVISKPVDYWYEVELNPLSNPQTIVGYDEDGAKVFKLFPEGRDLKDEHIPDEEDIPFVDEALDLNSPRPIQNQAVAKEIVYISAGLDATKEDVAFRANKLSEEVAQVDDNVKVERARIDNLVKSPAASDAELVDVRVGGDGKTYGSAGTAVREQFKYAVGESNGLKETLDIDFTVGTITNGIDDYHANRAKFVNRVHACRTVVSMPVNSVYMYGYVCYDEKGNYDGVDHGWNAMDGSDVHIDSGYFKMNFRKVVDTAMTEEDLTTLKELVTVRQFNLLDDVARLKYQMSEGSVILCPYELELGSLSNGEKVDFLTRARFVDMVKVTKKTIVTVAQSEIYMYGYCVYDEHGVFDGVDHQWNSPKTSPTVTFDGNGYVSFNFRRTDSADITEEDIEALSKLLTIETYKSVLDVAEEVDKLREEGLGAAPNNSAVNSIGVEYGRKNGASYVFVRIPKTTNDGKTFYPRVALTSLDGTIEGAKSSPLNFARRNNTAFVVNAGLFNMTTVKPVGQTIIDGVSISNTPMADDNGVPISDTECYPLCIDSEGNLSANYDRQVDTAAMIADGVVGAVTGWGKLVEDFNICVEDIAAEIVHPGDYIQQAIGQYENGDYCVCTVEQSRGSVHNEAGLTYTEVAEIFVDKGAKFAYSLDGGGSAATVLGKRQLNRIYEGITGRSVPTVIYFEDPGSNGNDTANGAAGSNGFSVFIDSTTGKTYRLYVDNGKLAMEEV